MHVPLAEKVRPLCLDEVVGQGNLISEGRPLRNIIESGRLVNMIFYGPPGTGKTTVAKIAAQKSKMDFKILNCTSASSNDIKETISASQTLSFCGGVLLYLDEIQYLNKKQQQVLLEFIENGSVTLIGSTTENPTFSVYSAILSRCILFEFFPVKPVDVIGALKRALVILEKESLKKFSCSEKVLEKIAYLCGGDVRKSVNILEACALSTLSEPNGTEALTIGEKLLNSVCQKCVCYSDKSGDGHYDLLSAFQKSMRGSDADAAVYYLSLLLKAGEISSACRRLMVCACEDVGLAYPQIIPIVKSCTDIALSVGMPEARIPLSDAVILVCLSPKSNSAYNAVNSAFADIEKGIVEPVPEHLKNRNVGASTNNVKYVYPHEFENHWVNQDYMPKNLKGRRYYIPSMNKNEQAFNEYWRRVKDGYSKK